MKASEAESSHGLAHHGIRNVGSVHWNLRATVPCEHVVRRQEGHIAHLGPIFGFRVPTECEGVPRELLDPKATWADPAAFDAQAERLAKLFRANFEAFAEVGPVEVRAAGPRWH